VVEVARVVAATAEKMTVPVLTCFMGEMRIGAGVQLLKEHGIPNYPFPERAALVLSAMATYARYREKPLPEFEAFSVDRPAVRRAFDTVLAEGRVTIGDAEARAVLEAYGLPSPRAEVGATADEAVALAERIGYPVVLKIASPDILHKTDVGGVKVGLESADDVRDAFDLITYRAARYVPEARLWGCLVQKMVRPGLEVLIGLNRDPQFGPLVTFGLGGIYVEALRDVAFRVAPFSRAEAEEMLHGIRAHTLLEGVRGQPPVDRRALVEAILRVAQLGLDFPEIAEVDINPYVCYEEGQGGIALDMRLVLSPPTGEAAPLPSAAPAGRSE
jgi:acetyltransferase